MEEEKKKILQVSTTGFNILYLSLSLLSHCKAKSHLLQFFQAFVCLFILSMLCFNDTLEMRVAEQGVAH